MAEEQKPVVGVGTTIMVMSKKATVVKITRRAAHLRCWDGYVAEVPHEEIEKALD